MPDQVAAARRRSWAEPVMGTVFSFLVRDEVDDQVVDEIVTWLHWVDATFSTYRPDSEISRVEAGALRVERCAPEVREVLAGCAAAQRETGGWFSATAGGRLDPSGLVKGWAVARASDMLRRAGSRHHAVNGGGDVQTAGRPAPGRPWQVAVADPRRPGDVLLVLAGEDIAVATSGIAERGSHVVDPFTGRPATDLLSVTVVGPDLVRADIVATAALARGRSSYAWLAALPDLEAHVVATDGSTWSTLGLADHRIGR